MEPANSCASGDCAEGEEAKASSRSSGIDVSDVSKHHSESRSESKFIDSSMSSIPSISWMMRASGCANAVTIRSFARCIIIARRSETYSRSELTT